MVTGDGVPEEQRFVVGGVVKDWLLEDPQEPLIGVTVGVHVAPSQLVPATQDAVAVLVSRVVAPSRSVKVLVP